MNLRTYKKENPRRSFTNTRNNRLPLTDRRRGAQMVDDARVERMHLVETSGGYDNGNSPQRIGQRATSAEVCARYRRVAVRPSAQ